MEFTISQVLQKNIVFVYQSLDLSSISLDRLRKLGEKHQSKTQVLELEDHLVLAFRDLQTVLTLGNRRLQIDDQSRATVEDTHLAHLAQSATQAIRAHNLQQVAYGFNFRVIIRLPGGQDAGAFFRDQFLRDSDTWKAKTNSVLHAFEPHFLFFKGATRYTLKLSLPTEDQADADTALLGANVHLAISTRPKLSKLQKGLADEYNFLQKVVEKI